MWLKNKRIEVSWTDTDKLTTDPTMRLLAYNILTLSQITLIKVQGLSSAKLNRTALLIYFGSDAEFVWSGRRK